MNRENVVFCMFFGGDLLCPYHCLLFVVMFSLRILKKRKKIEIIHRNAVLTCRTIVGHLSSLMPYLYLQR